MHIEVPYDGSRIRLEIPSGVEVSTLTPLSHDIGDSEKILEKGLDEPIDHVPVPEFLEGGHHLLVVINDTQRPTPSWKVLERIEARMKAMERTTIIIATGTHSPPDEKGLKRLLGPLYERWKENVHIHRSREDEMRVLGKAPWGYPMRFNRLLFDADRVIAINSVEPHYFAGYTGGRKSILPGIASFDTVENNHARAIRPEANFLALEGNPVHEGMDSCLQYIPKEKLYSVQLVLDSSNRLAGVFSGEMRAAFMKGTELARQIFCTPAGGDFDLVITCANKPFNMNLYQSQKALEGGKLILANGGTIVLVTEAPEGIGPATFFELLSSSPDPAVILNTISKGYRLGYHKAAKIVELSSRARIMAFSHLDRETLEQAHIEKVEELQGIVNEVVAGGGRRIAFLPKGAVTVPDSSGYTKP